MIHKRMLFLLSISIIMLFSLKSYGFSCTLTGTQFDDPSSVDRCYGKILQHFQQRLKVRIVKAWQHQKKVTGSQDSAGDAWALDNVKKAMVELQRVNDLFDHESNTGVYQLFDDINLTCPAGE